MRYNIPSDFKKLTANKMLVLAITMMYVSFVDSKPMCLRRQATLSPQVDNSFVFFVNESMNNENS